MDIDRLIAKVKKIKNYRTEIADYYNLPDIGENEYTVIVMIEYEMFEYYCEKISNLNRYSIPELIKDILNGYNYDYYLLRRNIGKTPRYTNIIQPCDCL